MTPFIFANNIKTTLASAVSSTATTITLASSIDLPSSIPNGYYLPITLNDAATGQVYEIVYATAVSGANLTVVRAQEGTSAGTWAIGDYVFCGPTAGQMTSPTAEIISVLTAAGITPSASSTTQLLAAIRSLAFINSSSAYTASTTLTAANANQLVFFTGTSAATFTLPLSNAGAAYTLPIVISNQGTAALTIAPAAGDATDLPVTVLQPNQACAVINDGSTAWHHLWCEAGTNAPFTVGDATASTHAVALGQTLGLGQTWQNVTGSRAAATNFYNTTNAPIFVLVQCPDTGNQQPNINVILNGLTIINGYIYDSGTQVGGCVVSFIVPPGQYYQVWFGGTGGSFNLWSELRQ